MITDLVQRFHMLYVQYGRTSHSGKPGFVRANHEMFNIAQALGHQFFPKIQDQLNECRREVMKCLAGEIEKLEMGDVIMAPSNQHRRMTWADFQITPEVASDPTLTFRVVPASKVRLLNKLHKQQVSLIMKICGG